MWHALKAELAYFRPWLLGAFGIAAFVVLLLSVIIRFFEDSDGPPFFVVTIFPFIAGMVVSFIAQSYRAEERRARLLLTGPLTPGQLAGITVLLPLCFFGFSVVAAVFIFGAAYLITGGFEPSSLLVTTGFAGQALGAAQLGPLAQEASAARRQERRSASFVGWAIFFSAVLVLALGQLFLHTPAGLAGVGMTIAAVMVAGQRLYEGRTDFTR